MAFRAFSKVLIKHGRTALDGLLHKGNGPFGRFPKQVPKSAPRVSRFSAKPAEVKEPPVRDWVRNYAWETLAADLRRRAAWQFTGSVRNASRTFAEGQRWLLFPAYAFVGLSIAKNQTPSVNAEEVDQGFHNVTEQIKGIFGGSPHKEEVPDGSDWLVRDQGDDYQAGHLIARGPRVALYKVEAPKPCMTELPEQAPSTGKTAESIEVPVNVCPPPTRCDPTVELSEVTDTKVSLQCKQPLPEKQTSTVQVEFSTADGKAYQVCLQVAPESTVPVAIQTITVDGVQLNVETKQTKPVTTVASEKIEELLSEAMKEDEFVPMAPVSNTINDSYETIQHKRDCENDMMKGSYVLPQFDSLNERAGVRSRNVVCHTPDHSTPSVEIISGPEGSSSSGGHSCHVDQNMKIPPPQAGTAHPCYNRPSTLASPLAGDMSSGSDIIIIDDIAELDLQQQDLEEPIFLEDLEDDPLSGLSFVDDEEAMSFLQHGYEGGYLLMTYFPAQEEMTSLSLPDTGENLWDAYEELFLSCGSTPTKADVPVKVETTTPPLVTPVNDTNTEQVVDIAPALQCNNNSNEAANESPPGLQDDLSHIMDEVPGRPPDLMNKLAGNAEMKTSEYHDAEVVADCHVVSPELCSPVLVEKKTDSEFNWENRQPTERALEPHPNVAQLSSHLQGVLPLRSEAFENGKLLMNSQKYTTTLSDHLMTHSPGLLESVVLFTQLADAFAHLDKHALVYRDLTSHDILLGGDMKWNPLLVADFGEQLYDKGGPRHPSYRDAVVNCAGNCSAVQPEVIPQESEPGYSDSPSILRNLATLGLQIFGCRNPLATENPFYMEGKLQFPMSIPIIFQHILQTLMRPDAHTICDARLVSSCMHLLLWCPQRYFDNKDPVYSKFLVTRWLTTFSALTLLKRSSQAKLSQQDDVKLQMKFTFLSTLDSQKLSRAVDLILENMK